MYENKCIICLDKCSYKPCKCNAYIHEECLIKWNESIYNNNLNSCPHCKNIINYNNINIKKIINDFINELNLFFYELSYIIIMNIKFLYIIILKSINNISYIILGIFIIYILNKIVN